VRPIAVSLTQDEWTIEEQSQCCLLNTGDVLGQWYSTFFVRVPPDIIPLQLCTPKVVGV
jgi:hypothetical protein